MTDFTGTLPNGNFLIQSPPKKSRSDKASRDPFGDGDAFNDLLAGTACLPAINPEQYDAGGADGLNKRKRLCRFPGCTRHIKSQGHCQRHGARAKRCRIDGCDKQAQGTHDGMCKRHWKASNFPDLNKDKEKTPPMPEGESVYDTILPQSVAFRPNASQASKASKANDKKKSSKKKKAKKSLETSDDEDDDDDDDQDPPEPPKTATVMPLVRFLSEGRSKPSGWHRAAERRARGLFPVPSNAHKLEPWEKQLALVEILLLAGGTPHANFRHLGHAWGREKGFHLVLANSVFDRRGEVERKRRSDVGKTLTEEQKAIIREKTRLTRSTLRKKRKTIDSTDAAEQPTTEDEQQESDSLMQTNYLTTESTVYTERGEATDVQESNDTIEDRPNDSGAVPAAKTEVV